MNSIKFSLSYLSRNSVENYYHFKLNIIQNLQIITSETEKGKDGCKQNNIIRLLASHHIKNLKKSTRDKNTHCSKNLNFDPIYTTLMQTKTSKIQKKNYAVIVCTLICNRFAMPWTLLSETSTALIQRIYPQEIIFT